MTALTSAMARNIAEKVKEQEMLRQELAKDFVNNRVDVYVLTEDELAALWIAYHEARGVSNKAIAKEFQQLTGEQLAMSGAGFSLVKRHGATTFNLASDGKTFAALAMDMRRSGSLMGQYRIARHNGKNYIIFKGYPGLQRVLTGTRYLLDNPRVVKMGIGVQAAKGMAKGGVLVTVIFSVTLNGIQWIFDEKYGWAEFIGNVSADIIKGALVAAAGYFTYAALAAAFAGVAVLPLGLGIAVALFVGAALQHMDRDGIIAERLAKAIVVAYENGLLVFDLGKEVAKDPISYLNKKIDNLYYYLISAAGEVVFKSIRSVVREKIRELARRLYFFPS